MIIESSEESSTSAMVELVMATAVSSFTATLAALVLQVGTSLSGLIVNVKVAVLERASPSYTWKVNVSCALEFKRGVYTNSERSPSAIKSPASQAALAVAQALPVSVRAPLVGNAMSLTIVIASPSSTSENPQLDSAVQLL